MSPVSRPATTHFLAESGGLGKKLKQSRQQPARARLPRCKGTDTQASRSSLRSAARRNSDSDIPWRRAFFSASARNAALTRNWTVARSEEHTSEIQSLMRIAYDDLRLKKKQELQPQLTNYRCIKQQNITRTS